MRSTQQEHGTARRVVAIRGELDIAAAPRLYAGLTEIMRRHTPDLVLDLSALTFCDSSGVTVLVRLAEAARLLGGELVLAAPAPRVAKVLRLTGVDRTFTVHPTVLAASRGPAVRDEIAIGP